MDREMATSAPDRNTGIHALPPKVLANVFVFLHTLSYGGYGWVHVTQVCRSWREAALGCPSLWANIKYKVSSDWPLFGVPPPEQIPQWLKRACSSPLDISIELAERNTFDSSIVGHDADEDVMQGFASRCTQIRRFEIHAADAMHFEQFTSEAPLLEALIIDFATHHNNEEMPVIFGGRLVRVARLNLKGCLLNVWPVNAFGNLVDLSLAGQTYSAPTDISFLIALLRYNPRLEFLALEFQSIRPELNLYRSGTRASETQDKNQHPSGDSDSRGAAISLPALRSLWLWKYDPTFVRTLFSCVNFTRTQSPSHSAQLSITLNHCVWRDRDTPTSVAESLLGDHADPFPTPLTFARTTHGQHPLRDISRLAVKFFRSYAEIIASRPGSSVSYTERAVHKSPDMQTMLARWFPPEQLSELWLKLPQGRNGERDFGREEVWRAYLGKLVGVRVVVLDVRSVGWGMVNALAPAAGRGGMDMDTSADGDAEEAYPLPVLNTLCLVVRDPDEEPWGEAEQAFRDLDNPDLWDEDDEMEADDELDDLYRSALGTYDPTPSASGLESNEYTPNWALWSTFLHRRYLAGRPVQRLHILFREGDVSDACMTRWRTALNEWRAKQWVLEAEVRVVDEFPSPDGRGYIVE